MSKIPVTTPFACQKWRDDGVKTSTRMLANEIPVAISYNGVSHAVFMASPDHLEDFAIGFSWTEGIIQNLSAIRTLEILPQDHGIEARIWLEPTTEHIFLQRRRQLAGPTGCGLCGIEQIESAMRPLPSLQGSGHISPEIIHKSMQMLAKNQMYHQQTHSMHAAALFNPKTDALIVREDVGRHNGLDKVIGAALRQNLDLSHQIGLLTSRVSIELIQKAAMAGVSVLIAVSAPTLLAAQTAAAVGITLIGIARADGFEVFSHPERVQSK